MPELLDRTDKQYSAVEKTDARSVVDDPQLEFAILVIKFTLISEQDLLNVNCTIQRIS